MKKLMIIIVSIFLFSSFITCFADEKIDDWKYYKEIEHDDKNLYKSFFLDEEIYKYSKNDLSDIRIINEKNEYVPYYIYSKYLNDFNESIIEYKSKQVHSHIDSKKNKKYIDFKITQHDENVDILGNKLILNIDNSDFFKNIEIYGSYDNIKWDFIKEDEVYRINDLEKLDIQLSSIFKYTYYRIVFLNDVENTTINDLKLIYNNKEITYDNYITTKNADYQIEVNNNEKNTTIYLNNKNKLRIQDIEIISSDDFKRRYYIYYKNENKEDFKLAASEAIYQIDLETFKATKTNINLHRYKNHQDLPKTMKIVIDNEDNNPIAIDNIKMNYLVDKIVFKDDGSSKYKIIFGNENVHRPSYDIEAYKDHIENEDQEICNLSSITQQNTSKNETKKNINYNLILNITIIMISIILVIIIIRKIKF